MWTEASLEKGNGSDAVIGQKIRMKMGENQELFLRFYAVFQRKHSFLIVLLSSDRVNPPSEETSSS